jgi:glutamate synthase (NADPH/NADH)
LIVETGEAREIHHHCLLLGFGADAICPYVVYEIGVKLKREGNIKSDVPDYKLVANYIKSVSKGILKVTEGLLFSLV